MDRYPVLAAVSTEPVVAAQPIVGYRTRAKLMVAPDGSVGLFAKGGGHHVVDIPGCRVISASLARVADALRERIRAATPAHPGAFVPFDPSARGMLRAVDLREVLSGGTGSPSGPNGIPDATGVLVTFVVDRARATDLASLERDARDLMRAVPQVIGVAVNFHEGDAPQILGAETRLLAGVTSAPDRVGSAVHFATFGSFVQAHRGQTERVHAILAESIGATSHGHGRRGSRVLDLYGGSGSIALSLAAAGSSVTLVEAFAPAVAQFRAAARAQGFEVSAVCADVEAALRTMNARHEQFDAVVVNPPRRGTNPATRDELARLAPPVIAYVSCDPATLARDLAHLAVLGYETVSLRPLDMIPLTDEVETVAVLRRATVPGPAVVYEDAETLVVDKSAYEPTAPDEAYGGSLLSRIRGVVGAEQAVIVHRLDVGTSGLVMFARRAEYVAKWQRAFTARTTRQSYIAAVRGIAPSKGAIARPLRAGGQLAVARTRYRRLATAGGHSILRVTPDPGHADEIRRQLASIGHPVLGDKRYGHPPTNRYFEEKARLDRTFLHCVRLEIEHPDGRQPIVGQAPLAGELRAVLERIGGIETVRFLDQKNALGETSDEPRASGDTDEGHLERNGPR
jgi:23S rRNA (uracil1939-C5)-methyltransferase